MNLDEQVLLLTRILRLIEEMKTAHADFIGKSEVDNYLRWAAKHLSQEIWSRTITKDYGYDRSNV